MNRHRLRLGAILGIALGIFSTALATDLGIDGTRFTIDGKPAFLLGISYYAGLGASDEFVTRDLDEMKRDGFNWVRVWATWAAFDNDVSAVNGDGSAREPFLGRLERLIQECDTRGIIVDVTLSRQNGVSGLPRLMTLDNHRRAVETLVTKLKPYRNWYLDLGNERNIRDARHVPDDDLRQLRERARELDPKRLITASHSSGRRRFHRRNRGLFEIDPGRLRGDPSRTVCGERG